MSTWPFLFHHFLWGTELCVFIGTEDVLKWHWPPMGLHTIQTIVIKYHSVFGMTEGNLDAEMLDQAFLTSA